MSSNNRTPASVLNAPLPTVSVISTQAGLNRKSRRHVQFRSNGKVFLIPKAQREASSNTPFKKEES